MALVKDLSLVLSSTAGMIGVAVIKILAAPFERARILMQLEEEMKDRGLIDDEYKVV